MSRRKEEVKTGAVTRRQFLALGAAAAFGALWLFDSKPLTPLADATSAFPWETNRPLRENRKFSCSAVDQMIDEVKGSNTHPELVSLFEDCFPNTLDTTVSKFSKVNGKPYTYLVTGDIGAMWLRDSAFQVIPYVELANDDGKLRDLITGVINQQTKFILRDPYANAHYDDEAEVSPHLSDKTQMLPGVFERKWEPDSLCAPIHLAYKYWQATGDNSFMDGQWIAAGRQILQTFEQQQRIRDMGPYSFERLNDRGVETVPNGGWGRDTRKIGLIHATHRPSDDACEYPFNIPVNLFASTVLNELAEMFTANNLDSYFAWRCKALSDTIKRAVNSYAIIDCPYWDRIYAYEIDGLGGYTLMDDANIPGLLSLPYLDSQYFDDPVYQNTREFVLSGGNPYFHQGKFAHGIGSPHTEEKIPAGIWPMSIIMRAFTGEFARAALTGQRPGDTAIGEMKTSLRGLMDTHAGTYFIHEATNPDKPQDYTRYWFAMANSIFGQLFLAVYNTNPELLADPRS
jgi:meiotically up-regulated gene 157 (Mug157) protein